MATIAAKRIQEALQKAKQVGRVEEAVTIADCPVVLQSLVPEDFEDIMADCEDKDEMAFLHAYQVGHIARSLVEVDGQDIRDVQFIEDEIPAGSWRIEAHVPSEHIANEVAKGIEKVDGKATVVPPDPNEVRTIKFERHEWLANNVLSTWTREAIVVAWRKFAEVVMASDEKAKAGVEFKVPEETNEDKYRRMLAELKEVEGDLPPALVARILSEAGYLPATGVEELERATGKLDALAEQPQEAAETPQEPAVPEPAPLPPPAREPAPEPAQAQPAPVPSGPSPEELMARRQPLNQGAVHAPTPPVPHPPVTTNAAQRAPVPEQLRQAAQANSAQMGRAEQIAKLEAQLDPAVAGQAPGQLPSRPDEVPTLDRRVTPRDPEGIKTILDQPPPAGINPRFKKPPGL